MNYSRGNNRTSHTVRPETRRTKGNRSAYVYGNVVRQTEIVRELGEPRRQPEPQVRKNREKAHHMSAGYVCLLGLALLAAGLILVNYIQMQAQLTNLTRSVASMESELNSARIANDEEYNRIVNSINLEEVKRIAIGELGMTYAQEGQIISYSGVKNDYMRKVTDESR